MSFTKTFVTTALAIAIGCSSWAMPLSLSADARSVPGQSRSTPAVLIAGGASIAIAGGASVAIEQLPIEAQRTIKLINQGGPFPFPRKDGTVFGNFERRLPAAPRGTYHEYTVPTPGISGRGAKRIITGRSVKYYTPDHYQSFQQVRE
jgi:ribonuclease T1